MPQALIALGTNLGDRRRTLNQAIDRLARLAPANPRVSSAHETAPIGGPAGQGAFLNAAVLVQTSLAPLDLLAELCCIERDLGRQRTERWAERTIDLDLLLYDDALGVPQIVISSELQIPHPRMAFRRFVIEPAAEVAPEMWHPLARRSVGELLAHLDTTPRFLAIAGPQEHNPVATAEAVSRTCGGVLLSPLDFAGTVKSAGRHPYGPGVWPSIQFPDRAAPEPWESSQWAIAALIENQPGSHREASVAASSSNADESGPPSTCWPPKLLVLLEDWELLAAWVRGGALPNMGDQKWLDLAARAGGPVLCAGAGDLAAQLNEITAAMAAME